MSVARTLVRAPLSDMNIQHTGRAGKTQIIIATDGACTFCGTQHASGWVEAGTMEIRLRTKVITVSIQACSDCAKKKEKVSK